MIPHVESFEGELYKRLEGADGLFYPMYLGHQMSLLEVGSKGALNPT